MGDSRDEQLRLAIRAWGRADAGESEAPRSRRLRRAIGAQAMDASRGLGAFAPTAVVECGNAHEHEVEFHYLGPGSIWIRVPALPGCTAIACDREQALEEARSVIEQWLGFLRSMGDPIPDPNTKQNPERVRITVTVPKRRRFFGPR